MIDSQKRKQRTSSAHIAAAAFNMPVMIIAGVIIGFLLSNGQNSPQREVILIGTIVTFFIISILELYYVVNKQQFQRYYKTSSFNGLRRLISEDEEE